jgi:hypothetical protein
MLIHSSALLAKIQKLVGMHYMEEMLADGLLAHMVAAPITILCRGETERKNTLLAGKSRG